MERDEDGDATASKRMREVTQQQNGTVLPEIKPDSESYYAHTAQRCELGEGVTFLQLSVDTSRTIIRDSVSVINELKGCGQ